MNFPILSAITFIPLLGSIFIFLIKKTSDNKFNNAKYVAIFTSFVNLILSIYLWIIFDPSSSEFQFETANMHEFAH